MKTLLPPNSTDLERKLAEAGKDAFDLPSIRIIKDMIGSLKDTLRRDANLRTADRKIH